MTSAHRPILLVIFALIQTPVWSQLSSPDFFLLAVGNSWTYDYSVVDNQQLGDVYTSDSGSAAYTVLSKTVSTDSTLWHLREVRDVLHSYSFLFDHSRDTMYALKDSLDFDLIEYSAGNHRLLRNGSTSSCWNSVFLLTEEFSDSSRFYRFQSTAAQDTFSVIAEIPAVNPYTVLRVTFERLHGIRELSYSLQVVGSTSSTHHVLKYATLTSVKTDRPSTPVTELAVGCNYPNPFNPQTTIPFSLARSGHVSIVIYDLLGRQVETILDGILPIGSYTAVWNALDRASGMYLCVVRADRSTKSLSLLYIK